MKKAQLFFVSSENEIGFAQLLQEMPITPVDSLAGIYRIGKLKNSWPFNEIHAQDSFIVQSVEERLAWEFVNGNVQWPEAMDSLYNYYIQNNELTKARRVLETLVLEHPTQAAFYVETAMIYGKLNDLENGAFYLKQAFYLSPSFEEARMISVMYLKLDQPAEAVPFLDYEINNNVSSLNLRPVKKFATEIIQLQLTVLKDSANKTVLSLIAKKYIQMGNKEGASKYVAKILRDDPASPDGLALHEQMQKIKL
jgi:tetratricopeptide (TPR) repeat protein